MMLPLAFTPSFDFLFTNARVPEKGLAYQIHPDRRENKTVSCPYLSTEWYLILLQIYSLSTDGGKLD
jgi:hypothetical protein